MIERKIYNCYAFTENALEKSKINHEIYENVLKAKAKKFWGDKFPSEEDLQNFVCYKRIETGYANVKYEILSNPFNLSTEQLALICDEGNLCFGYRREGKYIVIYTD